MNDSGTTTEPSPFRLLLSVLFWQFNYQGAGHAKVIDIDPDQWNPHQEPTTKEIEFLTDSDTTRFAVDTSDNIFEMSHRRAFEAAHQDRVRFKFAFTLPNKFWQDEETICGGPSFVDIIFCLGPS